MKTQAQNSLVAEDQCHQFGVCFDPSNPKRIFLYEVYTDKAAFDLHLNTAHFKDFDSTVKDWVRVKEVHTWHRHEG